MGVWGSFIYLWKYHFSLFYLAVLGKTEFKQVQKERLIPYQKVFESSRLMFYLHR